ncbi:MAG TPA: ExeM/NucH family extracellular endonuclease [Polyangiaceae bacterium]|nr:ExeM/NucH family extracellular endonuclease [Polyangiaceae bacterium]
MRSSQRGRWRSESQRVSRAFVGACSALGLLALARSAQADVIISEYVEGAGNDKAVELYNAGPDAVDLAGYALSVFFNGSTTASTNVALGGTLLAGDVFVYAHSGASAAILAQADQTSGAALWNGDDAIELTANGVVVDSFGQVGVDPGAQWPGGGENDTLRRRPELCTGDGDPSDAFDAADEWDVFATGDVSDLGAHVATCTGEPPADPPEEPPEEDDPGACGAAATLIHAVQGASLASPMPGARVTIEGVVTGDFQGASGLGGFFVQEEDADADADAATSEGVFVFDASGAVNVTAGDVVRVSGQVSEFNGLTELSAVTRVQVCATGASVTPAAVSLPLASADALEPFEGMLVRFDQPLVVNDTFDQARFGEVVLATARLMQPTQVAEPGAPALAVEATNALARIQLDDGSNLQNPALPPFIGADDTLRAGDTLRGLTGVLGFGFGSYEVHPTATAAFERTNPRELTPPDPGGRLTVASFNVLNYFTTLDTGSAACGPTGGLDCRGANSAQELQRQRTKILAALTRLNADVFGLIELQNDDGAAIGDLLAGLNAALGSGTYAFIDTGTIGSDAIKVGMLYKLASVRPLGGFALLDSSVDPTFIDTSSRPVLAQSFEEVETGEVFTLAVNHLKSKGSACSAQGDPDAGDGQGNCNRTRLAAAEAELRWLATDPTQSGDPDILLVGDFNAYAKEDPIAAITSSGYENLIARGLGSGGYSYVFEGQSGYLDHALASAALSSQVSSAVEWHINADEPRFLDYNLEFNPAAAFQPNAFRSSDHDPLVVSLELGEASCRGR